MKIKYEHDGVSLLTKCPHGMNPKVNSIGCNLCDHFGGLLGENTILCNYKEETVNIEELKREVEELKARIAEFEKQGKVDWVPEYDQKYWFICNDGDILSDTFSHHRVDILRLSFHNVYPTKEMAKSALPDITRCNAIIRACRLVEPEFVADWEDGDQEKYYPAYWYNEWIVDFSHSHHRAPAYVSTIENCEFVCELLTKWEVK